MPMSALPLVVSREEKSWFFSLASTHPAQGQEQKEFREGWMDGTKPLSVSISLCGQASPKGH